MSDDTIFILFLVSLPVLFVLFILLRELLTRLFPCKSIGPSLHRIEKINYRWIKCVVCGKHWYMIDRLYSIASDGDPESYLPVWEQIPYDPKLPTHFNFAD